MTLDISVGELEKRLEKQIVCNVLSEIYMTSQHWNKGGALIHRVRAAGYLAESGARHIKEGKTPINSESTFEEMRVIDKKMYDDTLSFLYPIVQSEIYVP